MRFLISAPESLHKDLKEVAQEKGQTLAGLIREILWDWVKQNENKSVGGEPNARTNNAAPYLLSGTSDRPQR